MLPQATGPNGATPAPAAAGPVGRITGTSVGELRFRIGPDEPVHLGEILIADARSNQPPMTPNPPMRSDPIGVIGDIGGSAGGPKPPPFYLRVVDLEYGADARDGDWEERTAGALMATGGEDLVLYDREERL